MYKVRHSSVFITPRDSLTASHPSHTLRPTSLLEGGFRARVVACAFGAERWLDGQEVWV
jgi:hypothetical protein